MNRKQAAFFLTLFLGISSLASTGDKEGHGGASVVCRNQANEILSVTLLDIWEQREEHALKPKSFSLEHVEIAESIGRRLEMAHPSYFRAYKKELAIINSKKVPIGENSTLEPVKDYWPYIKPETGCKIEQLAVYKGDGLISYDPKLWAKMDEYNRAALLVHETVFYILRDHELLHDSHKARTITAYVLSDLADVDFIDHYKEKIQNMNLGKVKDVRIRETIRGAFVPATTNRRDDIAQAEAKWEEACKAWQDRVPLEIRILPHLIRCNNKILDPITDVTVDEKGETKEVTLGYQVSSEGLIHGFIDDYFTVHELDGVGVASQQFIHRHTVKSSAETFGHSEISHQTNCDAMKRTARSLYKERLIYVHCEDTTGARNIYRRKSSPDCVKEQNHDHFLEIGSKGRIVYALNSRQRGGR